MQPFVDDVGTLLIERPRRASDRLRGRARRLLDIDHGTYPYVTSSKLLALGCSPAPACRRRRCRTSRHHEGLQHARRRRAVPDGAEQRHRQLHPRARQRVRHDHPPPPALRLARRDGGAYFVDLCGITASR
jgi:hypothetical protein